MDGQRRQQNQDTQHARDTVARTVRRADTAVHWWLASRSIPQHVLQGSSASLCFWFLARKARHNVQDSGNGPMTALQQGSSNMQGLKVCSWRFLLHGAAAQ